MRAKVQTSYVKSVYSLGETYMYERKPTLGNKEKKVVTVIY